VHSLTLVFKCRRCFQGDVVFTYQPGTTAFSLESRCSACRAVHQLSVELVAATASGDAFAPQATE
jgi:hypothetical protein